MIQLISKLLSIFYDYMEINELKNINMKIDEKNSSREIA